MSKHLYLLRHAKSSWKSDAETDRDRPLSARGERDAITMGKWLKKQNIKPTLIVVSPARRTRQTIEQICDIAGLKVSEIQYEASLYLADVESLLAVIAKTPVASQNLLLVGHNPGLEELIIYLVGAQTDLPYSTKDKLFTTGNFAHIELGDAWQHLQPGCGKLISLIRPKELGHG